MFGNAVLGIEGSTTLSGVAGDGPQPGAPSTHYENYFDSDFRGRAGYALGRFLPFLAAGAQWSESAQTDKANGNYRGALSHVSGLFGGGVDYMATDRIALRAEYVRGESFGTVKTHLDSETCCSQSLSSDAFKLGLAFYLH
jgi:opacity protein-like surface antigen